MTADRGTLAVTFGLLVLAGLGSACGDDPPPHHATHEEVVAACFDFEAVVGARFGECLGWTQPMIDSYIATNQAECDGNVDEDRCHDPQLENYIECTMRVESRDCASLCPNGSCFIYCPYFCKP